MIKPRATFSGSPSDGASTGDELSPGLQLPAENKPPHAEPKSHGEHGREAHKPPWCNGCEQLQLTSRWAPHDVFGRHQGRVGRVFDIVRKAQSHIYVRLEWPDGPFRLSQEICAEELTSQSEDSCEWARRKREVGILSQLPE